MLLFKNKCETDFLAIVKAVATAFEVDVTIETEPLADGGLRRYFKVVSQNETATATITIAVIIFLITNIFLAPLSTLLQEVVKKSVEKIFEDSEFRKARLNNLEADTEYKKAQAESIRANSSKLNNSLIIKKRSDFYETIEKYPKVEKIGIQIKSEKVESSEEKIVYRAQFKEYILATTKLDPLTIDDVEIEIISPVLKKGDYKWRGIYKGVPISFNMKSNEYKTKVQTGEVQFKNGSSIKCQLELEKKIDNDGQEVITDYNILRVDEYYVNDKPFETVEGKKHRQKEEADRNQLKMFKE